MILQWERPIFDLHARLEADPEGVSDSEARAVVELTNSRVQTNCDSAAQYLFFAISPVCEAKPSLTQELLIYAIRPLYYLGIESPVGVAAWVRYYLAIEQPYKAPSASGRLWLEGLLSDPTPLQAALSDVIAGEAAGGDTSSP